MARYEQIRQKAISEQIELMESYDWRGGFISGANWADKTMIEKACEKLKSMFHILDCNDYNCVGNSYITVEEFINQFKKYMEE